MGCKDISEVEIKIVAEQFNQYYTQVGVNMASNITVQACAPVVDDAAHARDTRLIFHPVTEDEVRSIVLSLRGGSAPGYCGISAAFLKDNIDHFIIPLQYIINCSLDQGVFPEAFKMAKVSPIYKSGCKRELKNYRPISLLSVFSKVLEKVVKFQFMQYLESNQILVSCQYGFRSGKSTSHALFDLNKKLYESINSNKKSLIIFMDLAKAFDSLDRTNLLKKLNLLGVQGCSYNWFQSYLSNRKQFVSLMSKYKSSSSPIEYGVIQGSTLGPPLFLTYINNISKIQTWGNLFLFADDAALLVIGESWKEVYDRAESDMRKLKLWFDQNTLTLNISKTKCMAVSLRDVAEVDMKNIKVHTCSLTAVACSCQEITMERNYKYLGVIIDNKLKWKDHISYTNNRIRKLMYFFVRFSEFLTFDEIRVVYFAYVQSILEGEILAWGGSYRSTLEPLLTTQKAIIKIALKRNRRFPSDEIFKEMKVLDVRQLYLKNLLTFIHCNYDNIFKTTSHIYTTRYAMNMGITTPVTNKTFSTTNSFYNAHMLYRNIPNDLKDPTSCKIDTYKKRVIKWLLEIGRDRTDTFITSIYIRAT